MAGMKYYMDLAHEFAMDAQMRNDWHLAAAYDAAESFFNLGHGLHPEVFLSQALASAENARLSLAHRGAAGEELGAWDEVKSFIQGELDLLRSEMNAQK